MSIKFTLEFDTYGMFFGERTSMTKIWENKSNRKIMQYKVIDAKSQYFGKVLDFESCSTLSDLGGVILKTERNRVSLFKFNEVELV